MAARLGTGVDVDLIAKIRNFLASQRYATIAWVSDDGQPQAAFVGFSETDDVKIIFGTSNRSRKYRHLRRDGRVALVVGDATKTVQIEGRAREVTGYERAQAVRVHLAKIPSAAKYVDRPDQAYIMVTPAWVRLTEYTTPTPAIEERRLKM